MEDLLQESVSHFLCLFCIAKLSIANTDSLTIVPISCNRVNYLYPM
jgi:hypothetical protein